MRRFFIYLLFASLVLSSCQNKDDIRPNILLIMADDMGYSDLGCFGGEMTTPNLDKLAYDGVRFTQFYNTARCCPSRASLMTGLYPHEAGMGYMTDLNCGTGYLGYLNDSCVTIAEVLADAGYFTAMSGKWHSGAVQQSWPENRGFQRFYGIHHWVDSYFTVLDDCEVYENGEMVIPPTETPHRDAIEGKAWYTTEVFTNKALEYMSEADAEGKPFFQYVAYNAPHWPLHAPKEVVEKYVGKYSNGYEALRKNKFEKMKAMGIASQEWILPKQNTPDWSALDSETKQNLDFYRAIYAAQVEVLDQNIGRLIAYLKETGQYDNTLILFLSDNGCSAEPMGEDFGFEWGKNTKENYDDWYKNPGRSGGSQGRCWSIASNSPFRRNKRFTHEGGISAPLIAHWGEGIKEANVINNKATHLVDIMATCVDLAEAHYPQNKKAMRGISFIPDLKNQKSTDHEYLFWEHEGHGALRHRNWKIVNTDAWNEEKWELYDIKKDRTETDDLSQKYPQIRETLISEWTRLAYETNVLPWPNWNNKTYNPVDK